MLTAGSAREDNPEELFKEEAGASAEGHTVVGVDMRLIQRDQSKDSSPVATNQGGAETAVHCELLHRSEEGDETAGVALETVQAGDERLPHDVRRELFNVV